MRWKGRRLRRRRCMGLQSVTCVLFIVYVIISVSDVHTVVIEFVSCNRYVNNCNMCSAYVIPYLVVQVAVHL